MLTFSRACYQSQQSRDVFHLQVGTVGTIRLRTLLLFTDAGGTLRFKCNISLSHQPVGNGHEVEDATMMRALVRIDGSAISVETQKIDEIWKGRQTIFLFLHSGVMACCSFLLCCHEAAQDNIKPLHCV